MEKIGIFFGSDTGNTERIANMIYKTLGKNIAMIHDIANSTKENIEAYKILIFGIPTWYYGELQCDWDDFIPYLKEIDFSNKLVGIFGCGDQEDYGEYFCDAIGIIHNIIKNNNAIIIGNWPNINYDFESSKALLNKDYFFGLAIDEDRQSDMTNNRVKKWTKKILKEITLYKSKDI